MILFKIKYILKLAWALVRKYWKFFLVAFALGAVYYFSRKKANNLLEVMRIQREESDREINAIRESHKREKEKIIKQQIIKDELLKKIEKEYKKKNKELDRKEKKEIKKIISDTNEDPDVITKRIAEITGFKIHDSS